MGEFTSLPFLDVRGHLHSLGLGSLLSSLELAISHLFDPFSIVTTLSDSARKLSTLRTHMIWLDLSR